MRRSERYLKSNKKELFLVEDVKNITGFSRSQLLTLEEARIVIPERHPTILYSWNQVIFLQILSTLRKDWTFKQIQKALKSSEISVDELIRDIHKTFIIAFGNNKDELRFAFSFENPTNDLNSHNLHKLLSNPEAFDAIFQTLAQTNTVHIAKSKFEWIVVIRVFDIIEEVKAVAKEKQIENFDLKVG
jgi:hypothetical protein